MKINEILTEAGKVWGREAARRNYEKETERTTGQTVAQRRKWYQDNIKDVKKRQAQHKKDHPELYNESELNEYQDPPSNKNNIRVKKTEPKADEHDFHGYKIRVSRRPDEQGNYKSLAYLPGRDGKAVRKEMFDGETQEKAKENAMNWIMQFSEKRSWDDIPKSSATVDFNREFTLDFLDGNEKFWNKFVLLDDGTPAFLIAPDSAEEEFGPELLRGYGYSLATPKFTQKGELGNTSASSISKERAKRAKLIPNGRYTLELTNKRSKNFGSDLFTLAFHSTVDAPNAPMKLGVPGVTIAASRK